MQLTKYAHACVKLVGDGGALVIDPGEWAEPEVLDGVDAVLITHEHFDHVDAARLKLAQQDRELLVHAPAPVVDALASAGVSAAVLAPGDSLKVQGFTVDVVGGEHAEIWCGKPGCVNVGFVVDGSVYHPGDALALCEHDIETLLLPVSGPWLKTGEAIDFARAVGGARVIPIHDSLLSPIGLQVTDRWLQTNVESEYLRLESGQAIDV